MFSRAHLFSHFAFILYCISNSETCDLLANAIIKANGVVPDVIEAPPQELLVVSYPISGAKVILGNELTPREVKNEPILKWNNERNTLYTVVMVDPDAPSRKEPSLRAVLHWLVGNVPDCEIHKGFTIAEYIGSGPPVDSGLHRYVILVYKQSGIIKFDEEVIPKTSLEKRFKFSLKKFVEKYNLGQPFSGNFYQAQYDDYVPILYKQFSTESDQ